MWSPLTYKSLQPNRTDLKWRDLEVARLISHPTYGNQTGPELGLGFANIIYHGNMIWAVESLMNGWKEMGCANSAQKQPRNQSFGLFSKSNIYFFILMV
jgi:hypothetical protein